MVAKVRTHWLQGQRSLTRTTRFRHRGCTAEAPKRRLYPLPFRSFCGAPRSTPACSHLEAMAPHQAPPQAQRRSLPGRDRCQRQLHALHAASTLCSHTCRRQDDHKQQAPNGGCGGRSRHRQRPFEGLTGSAPPRSTVVSQASTAQKATRPRNRKLQVLCGGHELQFWVCGQVARVACMRSSNRRETQRRSSWVVD